jgi:hypothetical protein
MPDKHPGYNLLKHNYRHDKVNYSAKEYVRGNTHTSNIDNFGLGLSEELWVLIIILADIFRLTVSARGSQKTQHIQRYVDEFCFRFNTRSYTDRA